MQPLPASDPPRRPSRRVHVTLLLWGVIALASPVSEVAAQIVAGGVPVWLSWARIAVLAGFLGAGSYWVEAQALRLFCIVYGFNLAATAALGGPSREFISQHGFISGMSRVELLDVCVTTLLLVLLSRLHRRRDRIYLQAGNLAAIFGPAWLRVAGNHSGGGLWVHSSVLEVVSVY